MALTQGTKILRRGPPAPGSFGYYVAAGEQIWRGSIVALNAAGTLQRVQTAGSVAIVGLASQDYNNTGSAAVSPDLVQVERGTWQLTVPGATAADIGAPVYATDDSTLSLTPAVAAVLTPGDAGNGTVGSLAATSAATIGDYHIAITSSTAFDVTDPRGFALASGTVGTAYSQGGVSFTIAAGANAFAAADTITLSVGGLEVGTLSGFESGLTYVRINGS